eukprot:8226715-Heterocapsa_arctica.AAC.1
MGIASWPHNEPPEPDWSLVVCFSGGIFVFLAGYFGSWLIPASGGRTLYRRGDYTNEVGVSSSIGDGGGGGGDDGGGGGGSN